jgi:hypothetical protein
MRRLLLQDGDDTTKTALLDFSYHLATGNMDEAFRAVKVEQADEAGAAPSS